MARPIDLLAMATPERIRELSAKDRRRLYLEAIMLQRLLREAIADESLDNSPPPRRFHLLTS